MEVETQVPDQPKHAGRDRQKPQKVKDGRLKFSNLLIFFLKKKTTIWKPHQIIRNNYCRRLAPKPRRMLSSIATYPPSWNPDYIIKQLERKLNGSFKAA